MKLRRARNGNDAYRVFRCPGCDDIHMVKVNGEGSWSWNGDEEKPTIKPSILATRPGLPEYRCHSFVTDGKIQFLNDCSHALAGQTVDIPDLEIF